MNENKIMAKTWWRLFKNSKNENEKMNYFENLLKRMATKKLSPENINIDKKEFEEAKAMYGKRYREDDDFVASFN